MAMLEYVNSMVAENTYIELCEPQTYEQEKQYIARVLEDIAADRKYHVAMEVDGVYAGNAELRLYPGRKSQVAAIGIGLSRPVRDQGIGRIVLCLLIDEAIRRNLNMVTLHCYANNTRGLHVYESLGFKQAGVLPKAVWFDTGFVDEILLYLPLR